MIVYRSIPYPTKLFNIATSRIKQIPKSHTIPKMNTLIPDFQLNKQPPMYKNPFLSTIYPNSIYIYGTLVL